MFWLLSKTGETWVAAAKLDHLFYDEYRNILNVNRITVLNILINWTNTQKYGLYTVSTYCIYTIRCDLSVVLANFSNCMRVKKSHRFEIGKNNFIEWVKHELLRLHYVLIPIIYNTVEHLYSVVSNILISNTKVTNYLWMNYEFDCKYLAVTLNRRAILFHLFSAG